MSSVVGFNIHLYAYSKYQTMLVSKFNFYILIFDRRISN